MAFSWEFRSELLVFPERAPKIRGLTQALPIRVRHRRR
jgi:hypothetical protein